MTTLLDHQGVAAAIDRLADEIAARLKDDGPVGIVGIRSRGEILALRLIKALQARGRRHLEHGSLDITMYRDDLAEIGPNAVVRMTEIEFDVAGRLIILVDDVLFTGRSVRAAIDALLDLGRPTAIRLAVLVDRGGRELPIQADFVGVRTENPHGEVSVLLFESDGRDAVEVL